MQSSCTLICDSEGYNMWNTFITVMPVTLDSALSRKDRDRRDDRK